jgi:hypothetical protein
VFAHRIDALLAGGLYRDTRHGWVKLLARHRLGVLELPSGRLVVADPYQLSSMSTLALERTVPAGRYDVEVLSEAQDYGPEPSGLRVVFQDEPPARWVSAFGVDATDGQPMGVPVDSASIAVASAETAAAWWRRTDHDRSLHEAAMEELSATMCAQWVSAVAGSLSGTGSVAAMVTGGDGSYPVWWGLAADDTPVCLVVQAFGDEGSWEPWPAPASDIPHCPLGDALAMLRWVEQVGAADSCPIVRAGRMPDAARRAFLERAGVSAPPPEVALFWDHFRPWTADVDGVALWLDMEPEVRERQGPSLPLTVTGARSADTYVLGAPSHLTTLDQGGLYGQDPDLATFYVMMAIAAYDLAER